jgi:uncharacterized membrane protein
MVEKEVETGGEMESQEKVRLRETLLTNPEGRLLLAGIAIAFLYTLWLAVRLLMFPEESQVLVGMTATQLLFGRAAGMAFGYSLGLENSMVIPICMVIETIMVLILFPLFVFSWRHLLVLRWLKRFFQRTQRTAEKRKGVIQKYGIIGLFVFVWFPFWMTGPFIGSIIGFLLGFRLWLNMTVVLGGTYAAVLGWAFFLRHFHEKTSAYSSYAAMILMLLLVAVFFLGHLLHRTLQNGRRKE